MHAQTANAAKTLPPFIKPLPPDAPPPSADPRDLHGVWMQLEERGERTLTAQGQPPPYTAAARAAQAFTHAAALAGKPIASNAVMCRPPGILWSLGIPFFPVRIMQNDTEVVFLFERFHSVWHIYMNQSHPAEIGKTYLGHSVGHWEGDTLVVDTIGLIDGLWLDESGSALSDAAHLATRITKHAAPHELEVVTTIDDPKTYTTSWTVRQVLDWRPDYIVLSEHDCEETGGSVEEAKSYGYSLPP